MSAFSEILCSWVIGNSDQWRLWMTIRKTGVTSVTGGLWTESEVWSKVDTTYGIPTGHKQESRDLLSVMLWTGLASLEADQCFWVWRLGNGYTGSSVQDIFIVPFIDEGLLSTDRLQQDFKAQSPATVSSRSASSFFSFRFVWTWSIKR